jgi:1,2-diacylglycerol-3-alpha-glucose alpha-1,2-galactosyltransferase
VKIAIFINKYYHIGFMPKLRVNLFFEKFVGEANGVYTAFVEAVDALKKRPDIALSINEKNPDCDVFHAHSIGLKYFLESFKHRRHLVTSAHVVPDSFIGSLILSELWRPIAKHYLRLAFNRAKLVVAVSPIVKSELEKIGVKSEIQVLCNAVDRKKFCSDAAKRAELRKKHSIAQDRFVALCVGQIQPRKGIYDFLETAKKCSDVTFVWVGGRPYGKLTADFAKLTEAVNGAPSNVIFTGAVPFEAMPGYYAMADVYFLPSLQENFAFATIEAASLKLPLLLRDNPEYPPTLFSHYLKGKSADDFASELKKLHSERSYLARWQGESDALANKYEASAYTENLVKLYRKVAGA